MADRVLNRAATIYTTRFTSATGATVTVINPRGETVVDGEEPLEYDNGLSYTLTVVDTPGLWQIIWEQGSKLVRDTFTVGAARLAQFSLFDLRSAACRRVINESHLGFITQGSGEMLIDETVIGGAGTYLGWWISLDEPGPTIPRRVRAFSGSGFTVAPRLETVEEGTQFLLTPISPHEVDLAIKTTMNELSPFARIPVRVDDVPVTEGEEAGSVEVVVPVGITRVHSVTAGGIELPGSLWSMLSGRRILLTTDAETVSITGSRDGGVPKWEDSQLDFDAGAVVARVSAILHASRAASQTMDEEENLRRQMAAMDEYMELRRRSTGRPQTGQKEVIE